MLDKTALQFSGLRSPKAAPQQPSTSISINALGDVLDHLAQQIGIGSLLSELGQCHSGLGHRVSPRFGLVGRTSTLPKNHDGPLRGRRRDQRCASPTAPLRADPDIPSHTTCRGTN
jgi:hypothetical protein